MSATSSSRAGFAVIGIVAAFLFGIAWIVAALSDPAWRFGEDAVSDLGVSSVQLTADMFMFGCILTGLLVFLFGVGKTYSETHASRWSGALLLIAGIFLILIGCFNEDWHGGTVHATVAILFFIFLALSMLVSIPGDWADGKKLCGAVGIVAIVVIIGCAVGESLAFLEAMAIVCALVWLVSESVKMLFMKPRGDGSTPPAVRRSD